MSRKPCMPSAVLNPVSTFLGQLHRGGIRLRGCHRADSVGMGSRKPTAWSAGRIESKIAARLVVLRRTKVTGGLGPSWCHRRACRDHWIPNNRPRCRWPRAGLVAARGHRAESEPARAHAHRPQTLGVCAIPELAVFVPSPTVGDAICRHAAGVPHAPRAHLSEGECSGRRDVERRFWLWRCGLLDVLAAAQSGYQQCACGDEQACAHVILPSGYVAAHRGASGSGRGDRSGPHAIGLRVVTERTHLLRTPAVSHVRDRYAARVFHATIAQSPCSWGRITGATNGPVGSASGSLPQPTSARAQQRRPRMAVC